MHKDLVGGSSLREKLVNEEGQTFVSIKYLLRYAPIFIPLNSMKLPICFEKQIPTKLVRSFSNRRRNSTLVDREETENFPLLLFHPRWNKSRYYSCVSRLIFPINNASDVSVW